MWWTVSFVLIAIVWLAAAGVLAPVVIAGVLSVLYISCGRIYERRV